MRLVSDRPGRDPDELIAVLDIGSSKTSCLIAAGDPTGEANRRAAPRALSGPRSLQILAFAHQRSRGIRHGSVTDLAAAQRVVRSVVAETEQMARSRIDAVYVAINCGQPRSITFTGHVDIPLGIVQPRDLAALTSGAEAFIRRDGCSLLALEGLGYRLDGVPVSGAPIGLAGRSLAADHHAVAVDDGPVRNLAQLVEGCHLDIAGLVPSAYASGLSATTHEERRLGVTCIDIGAGATTVATFVDGHLLFVATIPVGGQHLTLDIARSLGAPLAQSERIKALYGTLVSAASDEHELVTYDIAGDADGSARTTKAAVARILRQRMHDLMRQVRDRLAASSIGRLPVERVVLCGGTSRLLGLSEFVVDAFRWSRHDVPGIELPRDGVHRVPGVQAPEVRVARTSALQSMLPAFVAGHRGAEPSGPEFACLTGLLVAAGQSQVPWRSGRVHGLEVEPTGYFGRVERWLQDSF